MEREYYDSFHKLSKLHDNKLNVIVLKSKSPDKPYHVKTLFMDLYGAQFEAHQNVESVANHLKGMHSAYMNAFYSKNGLLFRLTGSKKLHLCIGDEEVLSGLKKETENSRLSDILHIRGGEWNINDFVSMTPDEICCIRKCLN